MIARFRNKCLIFIAMIAAVGASPVLAEDSVKLDFSDHVQAFYESFPNVYYKMLLDDAALEIDGQTLHPKLQHYLQLRKSAEPIEEKRERQKQMLLDPDIRERMRASVDHNWKLRSATSAKLKEVRDLEIPGPRGTIEARLYVPKTRSEEPLPVLVYFHGGGWLFGSVDAADRAVRLLANEADVIVISARYGLAPENKFPAAHEDTFSVYQWVKKEAKALGGDPKNISVGGDSAGANMAVAISYRLLMAGKEPPAAQLLYYPVLDINIENYGSFNLFGEGFALDRHFAKMVDDLAFETPEDREHIWLSPLKASSFKGMPPAVVITAGFDMLRDQGKIYAERLKDDGVPVTYLNYGSLIHGFMQFSGTIDDAREACVDSARLFGELVQR